MVPIIQNDSLNVYVHAFKYRLQTARWMQIEVDQKCHWRRVRVVALVARVCSARTLNI